VLRSLTVERRKRIFFSANDTVVCTMKVFISLHKEKRKHNTPLLFHLGVRKSFISPSLRGQTIVHKISFVIVMSLFGPAFDSPPTRLNPASVGGGQLLQGIAGTLLLRFPPGSPWLPPILLVQNKGLRRLKKIQARGFMS